MSLQAYLEEKKKIKIKIFQDIADKIKKIPSFWY